jgi:cytochrome c556
LEILKKAGTSENYPGLWRDVEAFTKPASDEELPELVSVAEVDSMAAAMAKIDRARDNLRLFLAADWGVLEDHPDLVAAQEARKAKEGFEATLDKLADDSDEQLNSWLAESLSTAEVLETALQSQDTVQATKHFEALQKACKTCHADYRN